MTKRRLRIDSTTAAVGVMMRAAQPIVPPEHVPLTEEDEPFWRSVIEECGRSEWTPHQLELAALLARMMADLSREQIAMRIEGVVIDGPTGPKTNPRKSVVQMLANSIVSMRRSLSIHARALQGDPRDVAKRSAITKAIEAGNPLDDDLIARPN